MDPLRLPLGIHIAQHRQYLQTLGPSLGHGRSRASCGSIRAISIKPALLAADFCASARSSALGLKCAELPTARESISEQPVSLLVAYFWVFCRPWCPAMAIAKSAKQAYAETPTDGYILLRWEIVETVPTESSIGTSRTSSSPRYTCI